MKKNIVINKTEEFVKNTMKGDPGHDWSHVNRVRNMALYLGKQEKADLFIVELASILHDVADHKFYGGDDKIGSKTASQWLNKIKIDKKIIEQICYIIDEVSFKGAGVKYNMKTIEGKVVQDADKLDAIGAIGVARTFSYGGHFDVPMYVPEKKPIFHTSFAQYKKNSASTINHFYEKLLLLKDRMHTKSARKIAIERHKFMEFYLKEFFKEWKLPR
ncbi:MAG TPA: HD domain-containing protein [Candidatus Paceibacterota bacterium]|nr:HD domain-containing protein [Candidatus Paceibacterota bacterium]